MDRRTFLQAGAVGLALSPAGQHVAEAAQQSPEPEPGTSSRASSIARIITCSANGQSRGTVEGNREYMLAVFDRALKQKPDLFCTPEGFIGRGVKALAPQIAEPVPGPTTEAFARRAKAHRCYVICSIPTARNGKWWNSAVLIDRTGEIAGIYDKVNPVTSSFDYTSFEHGISPGGEPPVFDLDFGRIGIQICFDAGFTETWEALAKKGAKAVFFPSAYDGGFRLEAYACLHHYYVISAVQRGRARIINPCGRVIAETDERVDLAIHDVNLDFVVAHYDFNWGIPDRIRDAYPGRVKITSYQYDEHFIVEPTDPTLTMDQLCAEFGFESASKYYERHRIAYRAFREGRTPPPQRAAHGNRGQYSK